VCIPMKMVPNGVGWSLVLVVSVVDGNDGNRVVCSFGRRCGRWQSLIVILRVL
jgi:hypothetical protein